MPWAVAVYRRPAAYLRADSFRRGLSGEWTRRDTNDGNVLQASCPAAWMSNATSSSSSLSLISARLSSAPPSRTSVTSSFLDSMSWSILSSILHGPTANKLVHEHAFLLADAESAVGGLVLHRRIPPAIEMHDVRGSSEIESSAAGFQRQHEEGCELILLELPYEVSALGGAASAVSRKLLGAAMAAPSAVCGDVHRERCRKSSGRG